MTTWEVTIEASHLFRCARVLQHQMLHKDAAEGTDLVEDFAGSDMPELAVNERHIWCICYDSYVRQVRVCQQILKEFVSVVDRVSRRLCNASGQVFIYAVEHVAKLRDKDDLNACFMSEGRHDIVSESAIFFSPIGR